ncbi:hypothetical protein AgCh_036119 [Apium graveolens]
MGLEQVDLIAEGSIHSVNSDFLSQILILTLEVNRGYKPSHSLHFQVRLKSSSIQPKPVHATEGSGRNIWRRLWQIRELQVGKTMTEIHEHSPPPGFTEKGQPSSLVDEDGVITLTPEEEALLLKIRAKKGRGEGKDQS